MCGVRLTYFVAAVILFAGCEPPGKPKPETQPQNITDFKVLFAENCAGCHGIDGKNGPGRILNDGLYLIILPRETLKQVIIHGRPRTVMPPWATSEGGPLTPQQIDALVNGIEQSWAKPVDFHGAQVPAYSVGDSKGNPDSGRKLFLRNCFMCHGPGAKVGSVTDPAYLLLVSDQMLRTSIIAGRPDLGMPDYRNLKLGKALNSDEITDLVAFLRSKRPPDAAAAPLSTVSGTGTGVTSRENGVSDGAGTVRKERGEGNESTGSSSQRGIK